MSQPTQALEHASVKQYCKAVKVPVVGANFVRLAEQAVKENRSHIGYLEALLAMESEERDRRAIAQRLRDAKLPRLCKALLDRITDRAHIIETGTESYRFRRTMEGRQKKRAS